MRNVSIEEGFFGSLIAAGGWLGLVAVTQAAVPVFAGLTLRIAASVW